MRATGKLPYYLHVQIRFITLHKGYILIFTMRRSESIDNNGIFVASLVSYVGFKLQHLTTRSM